MIVDGQPVVTGLHLIGDSVCTTNPTLGRGLALALSGAADLRDTLAAHRDDPREQALALDRLVTEHVAPFYEDQVTIDGARLATVRRAIQGEPHLPPAPPVPGRVTFGELLSAAPHDALLFRAAARLLGMLSLPETVYTDEALAAVAHDVLGRRGPGARPSQPPSGALPAALASHA
jgi:2-polyprenyl-6-methoxyphenol hydroxylase-like FAD-dependent oxidoreductase